MQSVRSNIVPISMLILGVLVVVLAVVPGMPKLIILAGVALLAAGIALLLRRGPA